MQLFRPPAIRRCTCLFAFCFAMLPAAGGAKREKPVNAIATEQLRVSTPRGAGIIPLYASVDGRPVELSHALPSVTRALLVFHGRLRNADVYNTSGLKAVAHAGGVGRETLLITPQFLAQVDIAKFHLPSTYLRWDPDGWMGGDDALNSPVSSYDAIDAILDKLRDRRLFPHLSIVVLAGHSAGAQVLQRYAVVGREGDVLSDEGMPVRYVIANPSSYVYFSPVRPLLDPGSNYSFAVPSNTCSGNYDHWKYGLVDPPPYVGQVDFRKLEQDYLRRDVVYLLGTSDIDPNQSALDKSCSGEDEGPYRLFRGKAYFRYLELRHPELAQISASQQLWLVPGVEHDGDKMLNSECGLAALFDAGACPTRVLSPRP